MLRGTLREARPKRAQCFTGIVGFAKRQGVRREHVWQVLKGYRISRRITMEWEKFQKGRKGK